jgi:TRAP-type C4-dicarboxylate transport system permease small subunit
MEGLSRTTQKISNTLNTVGGVLLTVMMLLTVTDVILRYLGKPLTGTFELMSFAGALVIGLAIAQTTLDGAHVNVDMLTLSLSDRSLTRKILFSFTRLIGIGIFALLAYALFLKGNDLYKNGEVSLTLQVPMYPVAYGLACCSLVECLVLFSNWIEGPTPGGSNE